MTAATVEAPAQSEASGGFSLDAYLRQFNPDLIESPAGASPKLRVTVSKCRRALTKFEPLLFALLYLRHHLRNGDGEITLSEFHVDLAEEAKQWVRPTTEPRSDRDAYICPRDAGKSTWLFLILPIWAAAHGHRKFVAAFADSGPQSEMHLLSFKNELDTNTLLREDFPDLCRAAKRRSGGNESDTKSMLITASGFVFATRGVDAKTLGMKYRNQRPDLIILDDIEPDESNYSDYQKEKRLGTVQNAILPLNIRARVVIAGTVTMPGSIIHDLVKTKTRPNEEPAEWVVDEKIRVHHYRAIVTDEATGQRRSLWPEKWPLSFLQEIEHTRSYKLNYNNDPLARNGSYWNESDFVHAEVDSLTHCLLSIDPAVTDKGTSDWTALAVIAFSAHHKRVVVRAAWQIRVPPGEQLRERVLAILELYPQIRGIVVEVNQGGDVWKKSVLKGVPRRIKTVHQSEPKPVRAARLLDFYQRKKPDGLPWVVHEQTLPQAEEQMVAFPVGAHDDLVDAIGTGVDMFLRRGKKAEIVVTSPGSEDDDGF